MPSFSVSSGECGVDYIQNLYRRCIPFVSLTSMTHLSWARISWVIRFRKYARCPFLINDYFVGVWTCLKYRTIFQRLIMVEDSLKEDFLFFSVAFMFSHIFFLLQLVVGIFESILLLWNFRIYHSLFLPRLIFWYFDVENYTRQGQDLMVNLIMLFARRELMADLSGGRVRSRPRLGWMEGVKVALDGRLMTVQAAYPCAKDRKERRALVHI